MAFFLGTKSQNWDSYCPETLDTHISSNQICLEHAKGISYNLQKYFSKGVLHAPIRDNLISVLKGFVVKSQILNLTLGLFFNHNSFISSLNEQCQGILCIYILTPFIWYLGDPI